VFYENGNYTLEELRISFKRLIATLLQSANLSFEKFKFRETNGPEEGPFSSISGAFFANEKSKARKAFAWVG
jgi:hypothetical protein